MIQSGNFLLGTSGEFTAACEPFAKYQGEGKASRGRRHVFQQERGQLKWAGGLTLTETIRRTRDGDMDTVRAADEYFSKLENEIEFPSARREIIDDVVGATPNVPAYLAGQPLSMRRKIRRDNDFAPLSVIVNLCSSATIKPEQMSKRALAILALIRILSARRPVELWAGMTCTGGAGNVRHIYYRIDTSPFDLARSGFLLGHIGMTRLALYGLILETYPDVWEGIPMYLGDYAKALAPGFSHCSEILAVPHMFALDKSVTDPVSWIKEHVAKYGSHELEGA